MISFTEFLTEVFDAPVDAGKIEKSFQSEHYFFREKIAFILDKLNYEIDYIFYKNSKCITMNFYTRDVDGAISYSSIGTDSKNAYKVMATVKKYAIEFIQDMMEMYDYDVVYVEFEGTTKSRDKLYARMMDTINIPGYDVHRYQQHGWSVSKK